MAQAAAIGALVGGVTAGAAKAFSLWRAGAFQAMTLRGAESLGKSGRVLLTRGTSLERAAVGGREFGQYFTPRQLVGLSKQGIRGAVNPAHDFTNLFRFRVRCAAVVDYNPVAPGGTFSEVVFGSPRQAEQYLRLLGGFYVG